MQLRSTGCRPHFFIFCMLLIGGLVRTQTLASPCTGDCNVDATVTVDELMTCVGIALEHESAPFCSSCDQDNDGQVTITEIVGALSFVLQSSEASAPSSCSAKFGEAASGVTDSATQVVDDSIRIADFGYVGNVTGATGTAQGDTDFVACFCPDGGTLRDVSCDSDGTASTFSATLVDCASPGAVRSGGLTLEVSDPDFCSTCVIPVSAPATQVFADGFLTAAPDIGAFVVEGGLTEDFVLTAEGSCLRPGAVLANNRESTLTGKIRVGPEDGPQAVVDYQGFTTKVATTLDQRSLCRVTTIQDGRVRIDDAINDRRFTQIADNFVTTSIVLEDGQTREVTHETPAGGSLDVDCLGGPTQFHTLEPLIYPSFGACATAGLLETRLLGQTLVTGTRYTATGGVQFDFGFDRESFDVDAELASCRDADRCRVPVRRTPPIPNCAGGASASEGVSDRGFEANDVSYSTSSPAPVCSGFWCARTSGGGAATIVASPVWKGSVAVQTDTLNSPGAAYVYQDALPTGDCFQWSFFVNSDVGINWAELGAEWDRGAGFIVPISVLQFDDTGFDFSGWGAETRFPVALARGEWHQVAVNGDGARGTLSIYLDGVLVGHVSSPDPPPYPSPQTIILGDVTDTVAEALYTYDEVSLISYEAATEAPTPTFTSTPSLNPSPTHTPTPTRDPMATRFVVDRVIDEADASPGDRICRTASGGCTLRAAIQEARLPDDEIELRPGTYTLTLGAELTIASGRRLNITGTGAGNTIVQAAEMLDEATARVLNVLSGAEVSISDVHLRHGHATGTSTVANSGDGGAILNRGNLSLSRVVLTDNTAAANGGAIFNTADAFLTMTECEIRRSAAGQDGGGLYADADSQLMVTAITIGGAPDDKNTAGGRGGGVYSASTEASIIGGVIDDNTSIDDGGGIYNADNAALTLTNVLLRRNSTTFNGNGGAIFNGAGSTLTLDGITAGGADASLANFARGEGGGIANLGGTVTGVRSSISSNITANSGGGIFNTGSLELSASSVHANQAPNPREGGGISNSAEGDLTLLRSTVSANYSGSEAGGIRNDGTARLVNTTITGNMAPGTAGGVFSTGSIRIENATITANSASHAGGFHAFAGTFELANTIVSGNSAQDSPDCFGAPTSAGHNLIGSTEGCDLIPADGDLVGADPLLGPLQDNGGPTMTHALAPFSAAVDAGNPTPAGDFPACATTDQRGISRPQGIFCDIGAYELVP